MDEVRIYPGVVKVLDIDNRPGSIWEVVEGAFIGMKQVVPSNKWLRKLDVDMYENSTDNPDNHGLLSIMTDRERDPDENTVAFSSRVFLCFNDINDDVRKDVYERLMIPVEFCPDCDDPDYANSMFAQLDQCSVFIYEDYLISKDVLMAAAYGYAKAREVMGLMVTMKAIEFTATYRKIGCIPDGVSLQAPSQKILDLVVRTNGSCACAGKTDCTLCDHKPSIEAPSGWSYNAINPPV